jgi:hypothetical protein
MLAYLLPEFWMAVLRSQRAGDWPGVQQRLPAPHLCVRGQLYLCLAPSLRHGPHHAGNVHELSYRTSIHLHLGMIDQRQNIFSAVNHANF